MECFDVTVVGLDKLGYEQFTRHVQLLGEMPEYLVRALRNAEAKTEDEANIYAALADLISSLFEAGN